MTWIVPRAASPDKRSRRLEFWSGLYTYAWFVSFGASFVSYVVLMKMFAPRAATA
jgi:cytosine/uracil/thiamine/allantoin permease